MASSDLMPVAEKTSRALLSQRGEDGKTTPTFPSFLPLEVFDDTEYDSRTPQEWLDMGEKEHLNIIHHSMDTCACTYMFVLCYCLYK